MKSRFVQTICGARALTTLAGLALCVALGRAQSGTTAALDGTVCDSQHHPLVAATVSLVGTESGKPLVAQTDAQGRYHFAGVAEGSYILHASVKGYREATRPVALAATETKSVILLLQAAGNAESDKNAAQSIEFSDQPEFTVAGLTDPTNLGGHGSDVVMRTKESLAKDTVSLGGADIEKAKERVRVLRAQPDSQELHALLGEIDESEGRPLEAVKEYERATGMEPSEANFFAWGAELLLHRALEPAGEVFTKGNRLFPQSVRLLVGLGVTSYARGHREEALRQLFAACDLNPADPSAYLFLGKIQDAEKAEPAGVLEKLKIFANLHPENAMANYYYAVGLAKSPTGPQNSPLIESLLQNATRIDSKFGDAYLQLGILFAGQKDFQRAVDNYEKAIAYMPYPEEAHFRLAQVYRQTNNALKARQEIELYNKVAKEKTNSDERERHEIGQFVYTLRSQSSPAQSQAPTH
jgi:tetratricopeptide (TPR) repeat protein